MSEKRDRIIELLETDYETASQLDAAIAEVEAMELDELSLQFALEPLVMRRVAFETRRRKELPVEPKGFKRAFKGARRDQRRTAIGRGQVKDEALFLRATKRAMQELQNRMLRRLRKTVS